jgi:hypothetical protein
MKKQGNHQDYVRKDINNGGIETSTLPKIKKKQIK